MAVVPYLPFDLTSKSFQPDCLASHFFRVRQKAEQKWSDSLHMIRIEFVTTAKVKVSCSHSSDIKRPLNQNSLMGPTAGSNGKKGEARSRKKALGRDAGCLRMPDKIQISHTPPSCIGMKVLNPQIEYRKGPFCS